MLPGKFDRLRLRLRIPPPYGLRDVVGRPFKCASLSRYEPYLGKAMRMRRREFLSLLRGAVPVVAPALAPMSLRAQQSPPAMIGILNAAPAASVAPFLDAFREAM